MRVVDVPPSPAYLVFHDAFDRGAMDVWPELSIELAERKADFLQEALDQSGNDGAGFWRAYTKLPRRRIYKYYPASKEVKSLA
jgi:hypothetical protein